MANRKYDPIRIVRVKKGESLKSIYAKIKKSFTAADLQRYTEDEEMFPARELVADLDAIHKDELKRRRKKKTG
jgi:hypothetical protein